MTHIFISYKREEVSIAQKVRLALRAEGFDVWWDDNLQGGQQWAETIDNKLLSAGAVVVLWSAASAQSDWVKHEASIAKSRNVLIPAKISTCSLPDAFASIQTVNLIGWNDSELAPGFQELSDVITNTINRRRRKRVLRIATTVMCVVAAFAIGIVLDQYYFFRKYSFLGPIRVALKTYHQRYVSAEDGGQNWALQGRRLLSEGIAQYETFELKSIPVTMR